ncbi:hypothetical protein [Niveibacterium sp. SC-1]|uniref:hypothetical protein n=1 Tax=Niveibacterium sp. SC-1 TaxID=3135646 RepID=UPI0031201A1E
MNLTKGSNRIRIRPQDLLALRSAGALVEDGRRQRPRWFDGRFLAARDLVREQQYFLTREADLGQAAGSGVAEGLAVSEGPGLQTLRIAAGHGITPSGELVLLPNAITLNLADIPRAEQLSARFGLGRLPQPAARSRNGLFVLALRPVEFTANPIGAYPTSITGQRTVEDGDVIEATAIVLVPWPDDDASDSLDVRRGQAARAIFVEGAERGLSANVLPIAMIALANNSIGWIDAPMVRRELGADRSDLPGLGFAPHALRLAHLLQHQAHVAYVADQVGSRSFTAASWFPALPPAGPLPPGVINAADFTQAYFPAQIDVEFAPIPEDELPALVEESLALPGFDLTADAETLDSSSVLVLAPVPRSQWRNVIARLTTLRRAVRPAAPNLVAARKPLEILQRLRLPRAVIPPLDPTNPSDSQWQSLVRQGNLWFVRRRNIAYREDLSGAAVRLAAPETNVDTIVERLGRIGLGGRLGNVLDRATPSARIEIANLLASPRFEASPTLTAVALGELARTDTLDQAAAIKAAAAVTNEKVGGGLSRIDASTNVASTPAALEAIANNADWKRLDSSVSAAPSAGLPDLASSLTGVRLSGLQGRSSVSLPVGGPRSIETTGKQRSVAPEAASASEPKATPKAAPKASDAGTGKAAASKTAKPAKTPAKPRSTKK